MRRILVLIAFALLAAITASAAETMSECLINCPPGNNSCTQCCTAQFDTVLRPCYQDCSSQAEPCFTQALTNCGNDPNSACYQQASAPCAQAEYSCQRQCDNTVQIPGACPGEVPPQKCPFDCQSWNPASKSCVGAPMNGCGSSEPSGTCPFDCQTWNPASSSCVGAPMNGCAVHAIRAAALKKGLVKPAKATPPPPKKKE